MYLVRGLFAYLPITSLEEVSLTCKKTVIGNCILSTACEIMSPLKGLLIRNMIKRATPNEMATPVRECISFILYGSSYMPAKIDPAAIPEVIEDETPANKRAMANTTAAFAPNRGSKRLFACCKSSTINPSLKKVEAANKIIALLIAHPITIEKRVSKNSYLSCFSITLSSFRFHSRL